MSPPGRSMDECLRAQPEATPASRIAVLSFNQVPADRSTCKYSVLGRLGMHNHAQYCARHGYRFIDRGEIDPDRPACWAKLTALRAALESHAWVLWIDSDALVFDMDRPLEAFCDHRFDLIAQYQEHWWARIGRRDGTEHSPVNTGVFLLRSCDWSRHLLDEAYAQTQFVDSGRIWNRIGDQEAVNHVIRSDRAHRSHIGYAMGLQTSPLYHAPGDFIVHFYGNQLRHHLPRAECAVILRRWRAAVRAGRPLPSDLKRFHWACVQNLSEHAAPVRGDLPMLFYTEQDIRPADAPGIRGSAERVPG